MGNGSGTLKRRWLGSCPVRCAQTGLQCKLLDGHGGPHATERGEIRQPLPDFGPTKKEPLDDAATRRFSVDP